MQFYKPIDLRKKQIKFTAKLLLGAMTAGVLLSILAELFIYSAAAKLTEAYIGEFLR